MRRLLSLVLTVAMVVLSVGACDAGKKSGIEGKVVELINGNPIPGVKVVAIQIEALKGYEKFETATKADGSFILKGLYPEAEYKLEFSSGQTDWHEMLIKTGPDGETKILKNNIELKKALIKLINKGIIFDVRTGLEWTIDALQRVNWDQAMERALKLSIDGGGWKLPTKAELIGFFETVQKNGRNGLMGYELQSWVWSSELENSQVAFGFDFSINRLVSKPRNSICGALSKKIKEFTFSVASCCGSRSQTCPFLYSCFAQT